MADENIGKAKVSGGNASLTYVVPSDSIIGERVLHAKYGETDNYKSAESTSSYHIRYKTNITVGNIIGSKGQSATFTANVKYNSTIAVPEGTVQFALAGTNIGTPQTVSNGVATLSYTLPDSTVDQSEITATYIKTDKYGASTTSTPGILSLRKALNFTMSDVYANRGSKATFEVTLTDSNSTAITTGDITLYIDDVSTGLTSSPNSSGKVTFTYTIPSSTTTGTHTYTVKYAQNDSYDAAEASGQLTIRKKVTLTPVNISANAGTDAVITIKVVDEDSITVVSGSLTFTIAGETHTTQVTASGEATYTYSIPADSTGDITFSGSYAQNNNYESGATTVDGIIHLRKDVVVTVADVEAVTTESVGISATVMSGETAVNEGEITFIVTEA